MSQETKDFPLTYSIPEAGELAGLGKNKSYEAADSGVMPTIKFGDRSRVPGELWRNILAGRVPAPEPKPVVVEPPRRRRLTQV